MFRRTSKHRFALFSLALVCTAAPAAFAGSPYEAFRFPDVHTQQFQTGLDFETNSSRAAQPGAAARQYNIGSQLTLRGSRFDQTDRHSREISLNVIPFWQKSLFRLTNDFSGTTGSTAQDFDLTQLDSRLQWDESWYTADSRWGIGSSFQVDHDYLRVGQENKNSVLSPPDETISINSNGGHRYQAIGSWTIDVGRGRVRDVTGVLRAAALEERLDHYGRLAHPLSDAARLRMAQLFTAEKDLFSPHDLPSKVFWREVARILREDGALKSGELDAEALERVQETLAPRTPFNLSRGTRVEAIVELTRFGGHLDASNRLANINVQNGVVVNATSSENSSTSRNDTRRSRVGVGVTTSHPQGLLTQWNLGCQLLTGDGPAHSLQLTTNASYQHMLLDRLYGSADLFHTTLVSKMGDEYGLPVWTVQLAGQLSYRVEDHWTADLRVTHFANADRANRLSTQPPGFFSAQTQNELRLGLTWRPSGRFDSPTLGLTERPMATKR